MAPSTDHSCCQKQASRAQAREHLPTYLNPRYSAGKEITWQNREGQAACQRLAILIPPSLPYFCLSRPTQLSIFSFASPVPTCLVLISQQLAQGPWIPIYCLPHRWTKASFRGERSICSPLVKYMAFRIEQNLLTLQWRNKWRKGAKFSVFSQPY